MKMGIVKSKETNKQIDSDTKHNSKQQTVDKADERPEWLPDGWDVEVRTRKSGPNTGSLYKCYIDPLNQYKFYSKPEVLRHLETIKDNNCSSKKKNTSMHSPNKEEEEEKSTNKHSPSKEEKNSTDKHSPSKEDNKFTDKHSPSKDEKKCTNKHSPSKDEEKCTNKHSPRKEEEKCISMQSQCKDGEKSINTHTPSNVSLFQTADKADERPEWLPDGWDIEVRTRKSGPMMGSSYKCYIDPLNQYKFYSKPEVLRHLETIKDNNCSSKKKNASMHSPNKEEEKSTNKHSPSKEEKNSTDKHSPSKEDKKYTDEHSPSKDDKKCTNKHSPSKDEEKRTNKHSPSKEEEKCINMHSQCKDGEKSINTHSPSNVAGENSTVEDLPPGWIRELKIRKNGNGLRKEWLYYDPKGEYVFHSKKDVLRYIESGDIRYCAFKPRRRQDQDADNLTPSPAAKRQKPKQSTPRQNIFVDKDLVESLKNPDVNNSKKRQDVNVTSGRMVTRNTSGGSVGKTHLLEDGAASSPAMKKTSEAVLKHESSRVNHSNHSISKNDLNVGHRFSRRLAGVEPVKLADNVINDQTGLVPKRNLRKNRTYLGADMENISSQHFNGLPEIEQPKAMNTGSTPSEVVFKEQPHQLERDKMEDHKLEFLANSNKFNNKKEPPIPRRASKRLAGSEPGPMNTISCEKASKYKSKRSKEVIAELQQSEGGPATELTDNAPQNGDSGNKRRKSPRVQPTAGNQLKNLEVSDEKSEPQLPFAFHYSWSDPCLDNAINTLTGVLPPVEKSVVNGPSTVLETDIRNDLCDNVSGRNRGSQNNSVDNGPTTFHEEADIQKTLFNVTGRNKDSQNNLLGNVTRNSDENPPVQSTKSKRKKEVKVPMRLSKRLAGLEPEAKPSDKPLEYSSRKSCKEEPTASVLLSNRSFDHLYAREETKLSHHASKSLRTKGIGESPRKSGQSYDAITVHKEQQRKKSEAKNLSDDRSKAVLTSPFGESWSDPCLEFAFKTLTGAFPVDSAAEIFKVRTPDVDDPPNNEMYGRVTASINGKAHGNSNQYQNKNEHNMHNQSSNLLLGKPELRTSSTPNKNVPKFTNVESNFYESDLIRSLFEELPSVEDESATQLLHDSRTNANSQIYEDPLKKNGQAAEGKLGTTEQPPSLPTEMLNHDNADLQFCDSFMNSWSDPCLEFAFKTLTGVIPVEENLANQGCIQEPANCHEGRGGGPAFLDFGSSSFSQSDFSFHYDSAVKSTPGQQSSMSSSFPSPSMQSFPGVDPQQQYSQGNNNFRR